MYLAEFVSKKTPVTSAKTAPKIAPKESRKQKASPSQKVDVSAILEEVHGTVESVIGHRAGDEQPLMEAGLDSLGDLLIYTPFYAKFKGSK